MLLRLICFCFLFIAQSSLAQDGFQFQGTKNKVTIPFQFINNLIIIPIHVNGVPLNFLLDTGVEESILFSVDETDEVSFSDVEKVKIKGFGSSESFEAYKSINNTFSIKNYTDVHHTIYLVLDQDITITFQIGIPVNGIIGAYFFKNNVVKINYETKTITIYKNKSKALKKIEKDYEKIPIQIYHGKPYITVYSKFLPDTELVESKLLIDSGNSDAVWFFKNNSKNIVIPTANIDDYLGRGFSGDIFGKRSKINAITIGNNTISRPIVAFPDAIATTEVDKMDGRLGSIGSEMLRRYTVVFDYQSSSLYLKKNSHFDDVFNFNMSGLEIQHQGLQWIKESFEENPVISNNLFTAYGDKIAGNLKYKFNLKPIFIVANVRKDSPAALAGLQKEDVVIKINKQNGYNYSLQEINDLLKSEEGKIIELEIDRKGVNMKFKFQLKSVL